MKNMKKFYKNLLIGQFDLAAKLSRAESDNYFLFVSAIKTIDLIKNDKFNDTLDIWITYAKDNKLTNVIDIQRLFHKSLRQTDCIGETNSLLYHLLNISKINLEFTKFLNFILYELKDFLESDVYKRIITPIEKNKRLLEQMQYWSKSNDI